jgi:hypothetical protein
MIEIKFTCNICGEVFKCNDQKIKTPMGWGAITPSLRVNIKSKYFGSKEYDDNGWKKYAKFRDRCCELKDQLKIRTYHICHKCLMLGQNKILAIEQQKKRTST